MASNRLFYKNKEVFLDRTFVVAGVMKAQFHFDKEVFIVDRAELTEDPIEEAVRAIPAATTATAEAKPEQQVEVEKEEAALPEQKSFVATRVNTGKIVGKFANLNDPKFDEFSKKRKLNQEAVKNILDGTQKTHKGFSFKYE